jgi:hypothetical protein
LEARTLPATLPIRRRSFVQVLQGCGQVGLPAGRIVLAVRRGVQPFVGDVFAVGRVGLLAESALIEVCVFDPVGSLSAIGVTSVELTISIVGDHGLFRLNPSFNLPGTCRPVSFAPHAEVAAFAVVPGDKDLDRIEVLGRLGHVLL